MRSKLVQLTILAIVVSLADGTAEDAFKKKHHHKRHKHHHGASSAGNATKTSVASQGAAYTSNTKVDESSIVSKLRHIEGELAAKETHYEGVTVRGKLQVNGPLPADFDERFKQAAARAVPCDSAEVNVVESYPVDKAGQLVEVIFEAPMDIVHTIEDQSADPKSPLTNSPLHSFLVAGTNSAAGETAPEVAIEEDAKAPPMPPAAPSGSELETTAAEEADGAATTPAGSSIDVDTEMPYGELEPFGREDTAQELTEQSIKESDEMVDQLERAEVAEEKRAVFRALTRLRGAAITSFDGVARSQTGNIDEYNKVHKWRSTHPLRHLADEESDVSKWAFPDSADF